MGIYDCYEFNKDGEGRVVGVSAGQLRGLLADVPDDTLVVLQRDSEGNGYSPLAGGEGCVYVADTTYSGEVPHPDDIESGEIEVDLDDSSTAPAFVLWPIN